MRALGAFAALVALITAGTAQAQDAARAFQCELPYRDTMMAMGSLKVQGQTPVSPVPTLHGDGQLITFEPATTPVFGANPNRLTLEFLQPGQFQSPKRFKVTFGAKFARTESTDEAIQQSVPWHIVCGALEFCTRAQAATPVGGGRLKYRRKTEPSLECIFEFTPEEFEALGR